MISDYLIQQTKRREERRMIKSRGFKVPHNLPVELKNKKKINKKLIPLPKLLLKTQLIFNRWIRERDKDKDCVSCGGPVEQAGHFYSSGHHSALRFSEDNTNGQCIRCNCFLHGNLLNYRTGLLKRIGQQRMDILESIATRNPTKKWQRFELDQIIEKYK